MTTPLSTEERFSEENVWDIMAELEWPRPARETLTKAGSALRELIYLRREGVQPPELSKRELFAAMAMQGMCANPKAVDTTPETVAGAALEAADALLSALEKPHG